MNKYLVLSATSAKHTFANRVNLIGLSFLLVIILGVYNLLWQVIGQESNLTNLNQTYIWYLLLGELIILSATKIERTIEDDIKSGTLAYYINKPISFFFMRYFESLGTMSVTFVSLSLLGGTFVWLVTKGIPCQLYQLPIILVMVFISCCIHNLIFTAIGFMALWLKEIRSMAMAVERLGFIFGGSIFPLTLYPEWFVQIAKYTPFYSLYYLTIKLIYDFSWPNLFTALGLNLMWAVIISAFLAYAYAKLAKKVEINGG